MKRKQFGLIIIIVFFLTEVSFSQVKMEQYKKQTRDAIAMITEDSPESARNHFLYYLNQHPDDLESLYGLAIAYTEMDKPDSAMYYVEQAVSHGLPFSRFLAGPRDLLGDLYNFNPFIEMSDQLGIELLHGPMLGQLTDSSASFWVRTVQASSIKVVVFDKEDNEYSSNEENTDSLKDYTATVSVNGLSANQHYRYQLIINDKCQAEIYSFKSFPKTSKPGKFSIGFGGGAGYTPVYERVWNTIASHKPLAFLLLGDNVYIDHPLLKPVQQYCYYRRQSRPEFRSFAASSSIYAIWDDHDFTTDDSFGGPAIDDPPWKREVWNTFKNNWINPYYGGGEEVPGCWFNMSIADVDFMHLDGRYYRMNPEVKHPIAPSMLGETQKKWLFEQLKKSKATFKIICSPVPVADGAKPGSLDTWEGFKEEREEIFSFIKKNKIEGVIFLSADRHRSDAWKIKRENAYDFYEFQSSRLSNIHTHNIIPEALFGYNDKCSFGIIDFDTLRDDPTISFSIFSIDNELIHKITVKKSQLTFKNSQNGTV